MSMGSSPVRMLWISIRAMQYTDRATREVVTNINKLISTQENMKKQTSILSIAGGVMWIAFASMASSAIMNIMRTTRAGAGVMNQFDRSVGQLTKSFGTAFVTVLGPTIKMLTNLFMYISRLPQPILSGIAALALLGITFLTLKGITMVMSGALQLLSIQLSSTAAKTTQLTLAQTGAIPATNALKFSFAGLGATLQRSLLIFGLFMSLGSMLGKEGSRWAAVIGVITLAVLALGHALGIAAISMSVLTWGAAAVAGLGAAAFLTNMGGFQVGTRRVQRTGPAIVHAGEMVGTERGLKAQIGGKGAGSPDKQQINATINFSGNIQTKADKEELRPLILKVIKEALDNKA